MGDSTFPRTVEDLGDEIMHVILWPKTVYIEGDQRSRDAPGHGYHATGEQSWLIEAFTDEAAFVARVTALSQPTQTNAAWKAAVLHPVSINVQTNIVVNTKVKVDVQN